MTHETASHPSDDEVRKMSANHVDPLDASVPKPDPSQWSPRQRDLYRSTAMEAFRAGLLRPGCAGVRESVLADLTEYSGLTEQECVHRATHSQVYATEEWGDLPSEPTPAELIEFYQRNSSWIFGLLWYAYLQAEGYAWPAAVAIGDDLGINRPSADVLDFGAGVGAGALMFQELGDRPTAADISGPLLDFATFRAQCRRTDLSTIDLKESTPSKASFDVVCAVQTMAHVPDVGATAAMLNAALRSDGLLFADFDTHERRRTDSRLYDDDLPLRRATRRAGFVEERVVDSGGAIRFRRVEPTGLAHTVRSGRDLVTLGVPRRIYRWVRSSPWK